MPIVILDHSSPISISREYVDGENTPLVDYCPGIGVDVIEVESENVDVMVYHRPTDIVICKGRAASCPRVGLESTIHGFHISLHPSEGYELTVNGVTTGKPVGQAGCQPGKMNSKVVRSTGQAGKQHKSNNSISVARQAGKQDRTVKITASTVGEVELNAWLEGKNLKIIGIAPDPVTMNIIDKINRSGATHVYKSFLDDRPFVTLLAEPTTRMAGGAGRSTRPTEKELSERYTSRQHRLPDESRLITSNTDLLLDLVRVLSSLKHVDGGAFDSQHNSC